MKPPTTKKELQCLIGKINFVRRFISNLSGRIEPFMGLVKIKPDEEFHWGAEQQRAFDEIKEYLTKPPVLVPPQQDRPFYIYLSVADTSIASVVVQVYDGLERVAFYLSRRMLDAETRYPEIEKLCLCLFFTCTKLRHIFLTAEIVIICKSDVIKHMLSAPVLKGRLALSVRAWAMFFDGSACDDGCGIGILLVSPRGATYSFSIRLSTPCTNNVAEYEAIRKGMELLIEAGAEAVELFGDSKLVISQLTEEYKCESESLFPLWMQCRELMAQFRYINFNWIPRSQNTEANDLAQMASGYKDVVGGADVQDFGRVTSQMSGTSRVKSALTRVRKKGKHYNGKADHRPKPAERTGAEVFDMVKDLKVIFGKGPGGQSVPKGADGHAAMWKKKSIFWELEYWKVLDVRSAIDVMHVTKNICVNLLSFLGVYGKTNDTKEARQDQQRLKDPDDRHPEWFQGRASYALTKEEKVIFFECLSSTKVPSGFSSNIKGIINMAEKKFQNLKSHDCHVIMTQLLPIALRGLLPENVRVAIVKLCAFLNAISQKHEGSIAKGYGNEEVIEFCVDFVPDLKPIGLPRSRHEGRLSGKGTIGRKSMICMDGHSLTEAHHTVLTNSSLVAPYFEKHKNILRSDNPGKPESWIRKAHMETFSSWLRKHLMNDIDVVDQLYMLAKTPSSTITTFQGYEINGNIFYTIAQDKKSTNQNSGVRFDAATENGQKVTYYGYIEEIWELDYGPSFKVPLFRCKWFKLTGGGVKVDQQYGMTMVDFNNLGYLDEPFVLAKDVAQVFYVKDMSSKPRKRKDKKTISTSCDDPKRHIVLSGKRNIVGVEDKTDMSEDYNMFAEIPPFKVNTDPSIKLNDEDAPWIRHNRKQAGHKGRNDV
ncbi:hypothetical protein QYE76_005066 [Lolium multiflorum]|uniref:RNase H type-1 domain-containing protein n=1 Tax=Lolium multiflorum TaxID=4521 RepID=A0AAD8W321_LOLMU|nr:hypothetical protein QYE76_005066 [Lolium multiflorum]